PRRRQAALGPREPAERDAGAARDLEDVLLLPRAVLGVEGERGRRSEDHRPVEVAEAGEDQLTVLHEADPLVHEVVMGEAHHVLEGDDALALLEGGRALPELEQRQRDAPYLAGDRAPELVLVHHPGRDQGLAEAPLALALHERGDAVELLVGDAAERDQGLAQPVLLQVAGREHEAPVVEEDGLHHLPGADLEVAALTGRRELSEGLRYGRGREVGQHSTVRLTMPGGTTQPRAIAAPAAGPPSPGGSSRSRPVTRGSRCPA